MKRVIGFMLSLVMIMSLVLTGCASSSSSADNKSNTAPAATAKKIKVGFLYVGPVGDGGYTYAHDQGRLYLEKKLGDKV